ncbi:MAG: mitochondrial fission ELM1 family protein [Hyphomicrobiaceae bacterium]|nr:mitochondrial fission ELM1 family protein [Hyphomicrobiaceae bacterium]
MQQDRPGADVHSKGVLAGARAWLITDGKAGTDVQVKGVADALGLSCETKRVAPGGIWRLLAPWGPVPPADRPGSPGGLIAPPWPAVAIASGRTSVPYIRALRRAAGPATFTVLLQDPKSGSDTADLIWVPEHDRRRGPSVIATTTAPHSYSPERLAALARELPPEIMALPHPRVAVVLGGKNGTYGFTRADDTRLEAALVSLGRLGASFMVTPSRRTHGRLRRVAERATRERPRVFWDGSGPNPYPHFLAAADWLVVTADSVNMTGEACATGRPVYVFEPSGGSAKFRRFHEALRRAGATRPLPSQVERLEEWMYAPIDSAAVIAAEVERRYLARRAKPT